MNRMNFIADLIDGTNTEDIKLLTNKFKGNGYAVWNVVRSHLARNADSLFVMCINKKINWYRNIAETLNLTPAKVKRIVEYIAEIGLLQSDLFEKNIVCSPFFNKQHKNFLKEHVSKNEEICKNTLQNVKKFAKTQGLNSIKITLEGTRIGIGIEEELELERESSLLDNVGERSFFDLGKKEDTVRTDTTALANCQPKNTDETFPTSQKEQSKTTSSDAWYREVACRLFKNVKSRDHNHPNVDIDIWAQQIANIQRPRNEIIEALKFSQNDDFWKYRINSPDSLEKHFATIIQRARGSLLKTTGIRLEKYSYNEMEQAVFKQVRKGANFRCKKESNGRVHFFYRPTQHEIAMYQHKQYKIFHPTDPAIQSLLN